MVAEFSLRARRTLWLRSLVAALAGVFGWPCAVAVGLNDTGVTTCADASGGTVSCTAAAAVQGQDARYGRDAAAGTGALTKVGGGANGFDFTKISNGGATAPSRSLPATAALGTGADDWGCTFDNTTGLMWEVKTTSGLRSQSHTYSWYNTNVLTNGGAFGYQNGGSCANSGRCDTEKFVQDVNAVGMCGRSDSRMPTFRELNSLVRLGVSPTIDGGYFPNTVSNVFWSSSPLANSPGNAWYLYFNNGASGIFGTSGGYVRLVRAGQ